MAESPDLISNTTPLSDITPLSNTTPITTPYGRPHVKFTSTTTLNEIIEHDVKGLDRSSIINLKKDTMADLIIYVINKLRKQPPPNVTDNPNIAHLETLCTNLQNQIAISEEKLLNKAKDLEESILEKVTNIKNNQKPYSDHQHCQRPPTDHPKSPIIKLDNEKIKCDHVSEHSDDIISESTETELLEFCNKLNFKPENGHSVCSFGEEYTYTNSKSEPSKDIPAPIHALIDELLKKCPDATTTNQCLINRYEGPESFLPRHCDDEKVIAPNSSIYTFSIGADSVISFTNLHTGEKRTLSAKGRSLYAFSRKSQAVWSHGIEKSAELQGVRFSITLRTIGKQFNRSTIILGDSNTKNLKFGKGNGTFGFNMPGERLFTPIIEDIDPWTCVGYSNIILHCGINNIKNHNANVKHCANKLINKIEEIKAWCPDSKLTLNPILPTKSGLLNTRARQFNMILFDYIARKQDPLIQKLNFSVFLNEKSGLLKGEYGRFNSYDQIHLGSWGVRLLVKLIKVRVCGSRVDGRPYASVNSMNGGRVQNEVRRADSVNRVGSESMMAAPITTSNEFPALSQHP